MKKHSLLMIMLISISLFSFSQENASKIHEVGISFYNFNTYGIRFKSGNERVLFRLTALSLNGGTGMLRQDTISSNQSTLGAGLNIGFEKRKAINEKFDFYYGLDLLNSYRNNSMKESSNKSNNVNWSLNSGLGLVLGLNYKICNNVFLSGELEPNVIYSYNESRRNNFGFTSSSSSSNVTYNIANSTANLTLTYRFSK